MNHSGSFRRTSVPQQDARGGHEASILPFRPFTAAPRIWLLIGDKLGDNQQVELIASRLSERLNWHVDVRRLRFKDAYRVGKPEFRSDHSHVDWTESDVVAQPWPDLVITVGRRPSMVALWIKEQSRGHTQDRHRRAAAPLAVAFQPDHCRRAPPCSGVAECDASRAAVDKGRRRRNGKCARAVGTARCRNAPTVVRGVRRRSDEAARLRPRSRARSHEARDAVCCRRGWFALGDDQSAHLSRSGRRLRGSAAEERPAVPLARQQPRQSLSRIAGLRRPVHRHRRQRFDAGRSRAPG